MNRVMKQCWTLAVVASVLSMPVLAEGLGFGVKGGTLGAGVELTAGLTSTLNGRLGYNTLTLDRSGTESDIDYDIDLELSTISALLDWHPGGGGFRATVGVVKNGNKLDMTGEPNGTYDIGDDTYTAGDIGTLSGLVDFKDLAPYVGIGWGNAVEKNQNLTFSFDLGVIYQGSPQVDLSTTTSVAGLAEDLAAEEEQLQDDLDGYQLYPVISLGLAFTF